MRCLPDVDDNLRCQFDVALPVLKRFGLTAFWFVYTSVLQGNVEPLEIYRHFRMTRFDSVDVFYDAFSEALEAGPHAEIAEALLEEFNPHLPGRLSVLHRRRPQVPLRADEVLGPALYRELMDAMIADAGIDVNAIAKHSGWTTRHSQPPCRWPCHRPAFAHAPDRVAHLDEDGQRDEYFENYAYLNQLLDEQPAAMSHPCNSYNAATLSILHELGITLGFRADGPVKPRRARISA